MKIRPFLIALLFTVCQLSLSPIDAQTLQNHWTKLAVFSAPITTVYFQELPGPPRIGFIGTASGIYRSTDGGLTWTKPVVDEALVHPSDFTFKDSLNGWFSNWVDDPKSAQCFRTTDGGLSWKAIHGPTEYASGIYYNPVSRVLMLAAWTPRGSRVTNAKSCISTDEGASWQTFNQGTELNGFAFIDSMVGIVTGKQGSYLRTTDGGLTWNPVNVTGDEAWQPLGDSLRKLFISDAEHAHPFISTDGGRRFSPLFLQIYNTTGTIRGGTCGKLYIQYQYGQAFSQWGVLQSDDTGRTWSSVTDDVGNTGPVNSEDTRFCVRGSYIFAGGISDSKQYALFRYVGDSTKFTKGTYGLPYLTSHGLKIVSPDCGMVDSSLRISFHYDCVSATLVSATLSDQSRFVLNLPTTLPALIDQDYDLPIVFAPLDHSADSSLLSLTYRVNGVLTYDTIKIYGIAPGIRANMDFDILADGKKATTIPAGAITDVTVRLVDSLPDAVPVDSIGFDLTYDRDVLSYLDSMTIYPPWSLFRSSHIDGRESVVLRRSNRSALTQGSDVMSYFFEGNIASNPSTLISLDSLRLNNNDSLFTLCYAAATQEDAATVTIGPDCGDSMLRESLSGSAIRILGIQAGPHGSEESVRLEATLPTSATITLYNETGVEVSKVNRELRSGSQQIELPVSNLPDGMYMISVAGENGERASTKLLLEHAR